MFFFCLQVVHLLLWDYWNEERMTTNLTIWCLNCKFNCFWCQNGTLLVSWYWIFSSFLRRGNYHTYSPSRFVRMWIKSCICCFCFHGLMPKVLLLIASYYMPVISLWASLNVDVAATKESCLEVGSCTATSDVSGAVLVFFSIHDFPFFLSFFFLCVSLHGDRTI